VGKGKREKAQQTWTPEIPRLDEMGFETVDFKCWKCGRPDYSEKNRADAFLRNGHKLFCTACDRPDLYEWKVDKETGREYLHPLSPKEQHKRIAPEAHALMAKQALVQCLRLRRDTILRMTAQLEMEYMQLAPAIEQAEKDVIEAEMLVSAMEKSEIGKKIAAIEDMNAKVMRLVKEIEEAKKASQGSNNATGGK